MIYKPEIKDNRSFSIIKLYDNSFVFMLPLLVVLISLSIGYRWGIDTLLHLVNILAGFIFFEATKNVKIINEYQVCFHQVFVVVNVLISVFSFIITQEPIALYILLFVGAIAHFLLIELKTTLFYFIAYHMFLIVFALQNKGLIATELIIFSFLFSFMSLFVNNWLTQLIKNSRDTYIAEKKFRLLFEEGNNALFLLKKTKKNEYEIIDSNSNSELIFLYSKEELKNQRFKDLIVCEEKTKKEFCDKIGKIQNQERFEFEFEFLSKDKKTFFAELAILGLMINYEMHVQVLIKDLTAQKIKETERLRTELIEKTNKQLSEEIEKHKKTQKFLIENTSKLNALFESSSNLFILTMDRDLSISSFNSSFKRMMKYHLDVEVEIGNDFLKTFPIEPAAYSVLIKKFKKALRGESVELISHFTTNKGEIWIESFISPVKVGEVDVQEIAFIAHNITEKVENEKKIIESEENNRATVSAIPDMLFKIDKKGYFIDYRLNELGENLLDKFANTQDLIGKHIFDVIKHKKQGISFLYNVKKALRTGQVHTKNFMIPFIIGKTEKEMVFENRYSRVNTNEVIVITRDITDNIEFETQLINSVKENEILLKEVHHRVKNNLQVISSILNLQSSYVDDKKTLEIINESQNRIRSMSYIHESLYQTKDFSSIDFHDYITNLVQNLVHSYQMFSGKTKLNLDIARVQLGLDQAIPCGLILNELVSNSLKHAYTEAGGEIQIEIKEENNKVIIRVEDFGSGFPKGFKIEESETLGLSLVETLIDQIDGELILKTEKGIKYLIIFEKQVL